MIRNVHVWDLPVRLFHWSLAVLFAANALFTDADGDLHAAIGYAIGALILFRLVWGVIGTGHARFADFPPSFAAALDHMREIAARRRHAHVGHSPLGALMVYNMLLTLTGIVVTGHMMTTVAFFGLDLVEEAHEALVTWAEVSVLVHIAAVMLESRRLRVNLPRAMVTGDKALPETPPRGH